MQAQSVGLSLSQRWRWQSSVSSRTLLLWHRHIYNSDLSENNGVVKWHSQLLSRACHVAAWYWLHVFVDDSVEADPAVVACGIRRPAVLTASTGVIRSPGYQANRYPNNALCKWLIRAPAGNVSLLLLQHISNLNSDAHSHGLRYCSKTDCFKTFIASFMFSSKLCRHTVPVAVWLSCKAVVSTTKLLYSRRG